MLMEDTRKNEIYFSLIIPVYNAEKYLSACLDSILRNSFSDYEVICINDGSKDSSKEILDEYGSKDSRIRIYDQKNKGVSAARNVGLRAAKGRYVCFVDSDDEITADYMETFAEITSQNDCNIALCDPYSSSPEGTSDHKILPVSKHDFCRTDYRKYVWGRAYKKTVLENIYFDERIAIAEDETFNMDVVKNILHAGQDLNCVHIDKQMYRYRENPDSITHVVAPEKWRNVCRWYMRNTKAEKDPFLKAVFIISGTKKVLNTRYAAQIGDNFQLCEDMKVYLKILRKYLIHSPEIGLKEKILYLAFISSPRLYGVFRVHTEPHLMKITYEKVFKPKLNSHRRR
jgi:glycosyltransferase involved in cell wall biosynthesis